MSKENSSKQSTYKNKLEALIEFTKSVNMLGYDAVFDMFKQNLSSLIGVDRFSIFLLDEDNSNFFILVHDHAEKELDKLKFPIDKSPIMKESYNRMSGVLEDNFTESKYVTDIKRKKYKDNFAYCLPLRAGSKLFGVLNLNGNSQGFFDSDGLQFALLISEIVSISINNFIQLEEQKELASTDGLTGLLNLRSFYEQLNMEYERSIRFKNVLSCIIVDIDCFKEINDAYGHQVGNTVIRELAVRLTKQLRKVDTLARYGGEEFALLLPKTKSQSAMVVAERLRTNVALVPFETSAGPIKVTITLGISDTLMNGVDSSDQILVKADAALYKAKKEGRNKSGIDEE
ncbi:MAG TPA: sensor domain-containing diguanylate cyclase [Nitrospinota bacterium]|nr:sensor domain-containing diguanylate cyclase [Nitrospinota bacterium]